MLKLVKLYVLKHAILSFHQKEPALLNALQERHWKPILEWARSTFNVEVSTSTSFLLDPHPPETVQKFDDVMSKFDQWQMAGTSSFKGYNEAASYTMQWEAMERATYTSKSFLIALALVMKQITAEQAAHASHVEVNSQIEKWGEVEDCKAYFKWTIAHDD